jgi:Pvc16 N-terminal domain
MIDDVDASLRALLENALGRGTAIRFEPPTPEWSSALKGATLDLFLYDVIEEIDRRSADWEDQRNDAGRVSGRQPPVRYYRLSYLVSAWGKSTEDEHALLAAVMRACLGGEVLPPQFCRGSLAGEESPVLLRLCLPASEPPARAHDLWSSVGQSARSSLELSVVAPLRPVLVTDIAAPAEQISLDMNTDPRQGDANAAAGGGGAQRLPAPGSVPGTVAPIDKRWTAFRIRERENSPPKT